METLSQMKDRIRNKLLNEGVSSFEESDKVKLVKSEIAHHYLEDDFFVEMNKSMRVSLIHHHLLEEVNNGVLSVDEATAIKKEYLAAENEDIYESPNLTPIDKSHVKSWEPNDGESVEKSMFYDILEYMYAGKVEGLAKEMLDIFKDKAGDPYALSNEVEEYTEMAFSLGLADSVLDASKEDLLDGFEESLEEQDLKRALFFIAAVEFGIKNKTILAEKKKKRKSRRKRYGFPYWGGAYGYDGDSGGDGGGGE